MRPDRARDAAQRAYHDVPRELERRNEILGGRPASRARGRGDRKRGGELEPAALHPQPAPARRPARERLIHRLRRRLSFFVLILFIFLAVCWNGCVRPIASSSHIPPGFTSASKSNRPFARFAERLDPIRPDAAWMRTGPWNGSGQGRTGIDHVVASLGSDDTQCRSAERHPQRALTSIRVSISADQKLGVT